MCSAFEEATAFVFTFGMTEVFVDRKSGKFVGQKPAYGGGGGLIETSLHQSTFEENLDNVRAIIRLIRERKQHEVPIIMSVSPVPLSRTFGSDDVVVASCEGKSILRAVLSQIKREFPETRYFPSYEFVNALGPPAYKDDQRHVANEIIGDIMTGFFACYGR